MVERHKVEAVLLRRFPGAPSRDVAAAVNAIVGLVDDWQEVSPLEFWRLHEEADTSEMRVFRRRRRWSAQVRTQPGIGEPSTACGGASVPGRAE